jgi:hypothetical protein
VDHHRFDYSGSFYHKQDATIMTETMENTLDKLVKRIREVRGWLLALAVLKVTAIALGFASVYIIGYALLDHYFHIGASGRLTACLLFFAGMLYLVIQLVRNLYRHISCGNAANFVESRMNFDQQLVTVVEYYENRSDYPYSESLAAHLVGQVDQAASNVNFKTAVPKWKIAGLALVVVLGGIPTGCYIYNHSVFFSRYFSRLVNPLATVNPLPATTLKDLSGDMVAEPEQIVTPSARIDGRIPQTARLVLESTRPAAPLQKAISLAPTPGETRLQTEVMLPEGHYRYRFEAGDAASEWKTITVTRLPKLTTITAEVSFPGSKTLQPYTEEIKDDTFEVIKGAHVKLTAKTSLPIKGVKVSDRDQKEIASSVMAGDTVQAQFDVQREETLRFQLATEQLENIETSPLRIALKVNKPAEIKLICPEGDHSATNVASIPIVFEASDDFGLNSATIFAEVAGKTITASPASFSRGVQKATFETILELEVYDLDVGDSIIFYARAEDVNIEDDSKPGSQSTSEIYFIEIAHYRRLWFAPSSGLPGQPKQGLKISAHDRLIDILEYNRAFIKKTWPISQANELSAQDQSRMDSIAHDVDYAAEQLTLIRNDPKYHFDDVDKAKLDEILNHYDKAVDHLNGRVPIGALNAEKEAYQALRKFILDLVRVIPPQGNAPPPQNKPDRVKIDDQVHVTRYEKEKIEWELKLLSDKLEALRTKEEELKKTFDRFLEELTKAAKTNPAIHGEQSWRDPNEKNDSKPSSADSERQNSCEPNFTMEGAIPPSPPQAQTGQQTQGASGENNAATLQEQMSLLQARQKAIEKEIEAIKKAMEQLPTPDSDQRKDSLADEVARRLTRQHLDNAVGKMKAFQNNVNESNYQEEKQRAKSLEQASDSLENAIKEMAEAAEALKSQYALTKEEQTAQAARQIAEDLDKLAREYDESVSPEERREMLNSLELARKLLEMAKASEVIDVDQPARPGGQSNPGQGTVSNVKRNPYYDNSLPPPEKAKLLALKFWSISIEAKKRQTQVIEEDPSDAEFYLLENRYFETAARFNVTKEQQ